VTGVLITYVSAVPAREDARHIRHAVSDFVTGDAGVTEVRWASLEEARALMGDMADPVSQYLQRTLQSGRW